MIYIYEHLKSTTDELARWLDDHGSAVIVDARRKVVSPRRPDWSKENLRQKFVGWYMHCEGVGTGAAKRDAIDSFRVIAKVSDVVVLSSAPSQRGESAMGLEQFSALLREQSGADVTVLDLSPVEEVVEEGMSVAEAAAYLGISVHGVQHHLRKNGFLRRYALKNESGKWRFTEEALEQWKRDK